LQGDYGAPTYRATQLIGCGRCFNSMKRVLLAEDNDEVRALLVEVLTEAGYAVEDALSFSAAKEKLNQGTFDLLITNVLLPGGGHGTDLASIAASKGMKYLIVTGNPNQMEVALRHPHILKPFRIVDFVQRINRMWEGD
jgi:two-component system cell cycle response regulator CpdR